MKNLKLTIAMAALLISASATSFAQCGDKSSKKADKSYNGAISSHASDIVDIAAASADFTTLVAAVTAAGLGDALKADGPFTVFAPTNAAFGKVPAETLNSLLKPENKDQLTAILTYHVVAGSLDAATVLKAIKEGDGKAVVKTLNGGDLTAMIMDEKVVLKDANGNISIVTQTDLKASNGYIHVIDTVVLP